MTRDDIIRSFLALHPDTPIDGREYAIPLRVISRILEAAVKLERDECAKVCDEMAVDGDTCGMLYAQVCAKSIRARGR
jgi:hypothetical protein